MAAARGLRDLSGVILWGVALGLAFLASYLARAIAAPFNYNFPVVGRVFGFVADAIEAGIVGPMNEVRKASEAEITAGLSNLVDDWGLALGLVLVLGLGIKAALDYLWHDALRPLIHAIVNPVLAVAHEGLTKVEALTRTVAENVLHAERYAEAQAAAALADARAYAEHVAVVAEHTAESYADEAVSKLRSAEDAAVANVIRLAENAKAAGEAAAARALSTAETEIRAAESEAASLARAATAEAEADAARLVAASDAAFDTAIGDVKAIAAGAEHGITDLQRLIDSLGLAGLVAAVPALALLVNTLATESGLDSSACRAKNNQICGVDPSRWTHLLEGLAVAGLTFSLAELVQVAEPIVAELAPVIAQAA